MISKINRMYVRRYRDTGQEKFYVEWTDTKGNNGRTECSAVCECCGSNKIGTHMQALMARGFREGLQLDHETW
jgi:hypothetical protein